MSRLRGRDDTRSAIAVLADALQQEGIASVAEGDFRSAARRGYAEPQDKINGCHRQRVEGEGAG